MAQLRTKAKKGKPRWLRQSLPKGPHYQQVRTLLGRRGLHTVCQEAKCPNLWECFSRQTATFLILGPRCTRNCRFCAVASGPSGPPDPEEPARVAEAARALGLDHVVVTSVTRDDLPDGGAHLFRKTIEAVRTRIPRASVEVLIPDFRGDKAGLLTVLEGRPHVLNHNLETVERLYPRARPEALYRRSLELLLRAGHMAPAIPTKSGLMLGLGESPEEIRQALGHLLETGCEMLTLGQYLQPSKAHLPVERFIPPEEFAAWKETALTMGFLKVASGPFVRSSFRAKELYQAVVRTRGRTGHDQSMSS